MVSEEIVCKSVCLSVENFEIWYFPADFHFFAEDVRKLFPVVFCSY